MVKNSSPPTASSIAPPQARRRRAAMFQVYVLAALAIFVVFALLARAQPYFAIDLTITRAFQAHQHPALAALMFGLSWLGFLPQVAILGAVAVVALFLAGLRWEAVSLGFAACGSVVGTLVKLVVVRPRPGADLVHVLNPLSTSSFPSLHVVAFTTTCGFLIFLVYTMLKPSWLRTALMAALGLIIVLMGPSRIYLGHHWFSDVMGGYVFSSLWLVWTIQFYRWGKPHVFKR